MFAATISGSVLAVLRPIGPVWCALIIFTSLIAAPVDLPKIKRIISDRGLWLGAGIVTCSSLAGLAWTLTMHTTHLSASDIPPLSFGAQLRLTAEQVPLWLLQSIAAFPYRDEPTAPLVYIAYLALGIGLLLFAVRHGYRNRRLAAAIMVTIAVAVVLPAASTLATFEQYATSWQGRYGMPYTVGTLLLLTWALDRAGRPIAWRAFYPAAVLFTIAHSVSLADTLKREISSDPAHGSGAWLAPSVTLLASWGVLGAISVLIGARTVRSETAVSADTVATGARSRVEREHAAKGHAETS